jgi:hypothetical protein
LTADFIGRRHLAPKRLARHHAVGLKFWIAGLVELGVRLELPLFTREPGQDAALDGGEVTGDEPVPRRGAYNPALDVAHDCQRRSELAHFGKITGEDRGDRAVDVLGLRLLEILRLEPAPGPASRGSGVEDQRAAESAVRIHAREQTLELVGRCAATFLPELEHAANHVTWGVREDGAHGALRYTGELVAAAPDEGLDLRHLVDGDDLAAGDVAELRGDGGARGQDDLVRGPRESDVHAVAARVDGRVQRPELLLGSRQRR